VNSEAAARAANAIGRIASERVGALPADSQAAFAALRLFPRLPNTFSESAALAVAACDIAILRTLARGGLLEDTKTSRYAMHPAIATASGEASDPAARGRFATYFANYAHTHANEPRALEIEQENLLVAFDFGGPEQRSEIALGMSRFLELRGEYSTWHRLVTVAVPAHGTVSVALQLQRARASEKLGNNRAAEEHAAKGLEIAGAESPFAPELLAILGHAEMNRGLLSQAHRHLTDAVSLSDTVPGSPAMGEALRSLGVVATRLSLYEEAGAALSRALELASERADVAAEATVWTDLAVLCAHQRRADEAEAAARRSLAAARQIGYSEKEAAALEALGGILLDRGAFSESDDVLQQALRIAQRIGHRWYVATVLNQLGNLYLRLEHNDGALACFREAIEQSPAETPDVRAYSQFGMARALFSKADYPQSSRQAHDALAIFEQMTHHAAADVRDWLADHHRS
jgi:tetratricopeptide (TPR) repeat protein